MTDNTNLSNKDVLIVSVLLTYCLGSVLAIAHSPNSVMGLTGSGKSSFINLATQSRNELPVGHSITSCTDRVIRADPFELDGHRIVLFDTPGFNDTNASEIEILRLIAFELEKQYRQGQILHGIIYAHKITEQRVGGLAKSNFRLFRKLCGEKALQNVLITTTMWSRLTTREEGLLRVEELEKLDGFLKPAIAKHAKLVHHTQDTVDSARGILRQILANNPTPLSIQEEIVVQGKTIAETDAGKALDEELTKLAQQYEQKLKDQTEAAEQAMLQQDEETRQEQLEAAEQSRQLLASLEEQKRDQVRRYQLLQAQFADAERKPEQAIRGAEEISPREPQAPKAGRRQEVEAAERRQAQERMRNIEIPSSSYSGRAVNGDDDDYEECAQGPPEEEERKSEEAQAAEARPPQEARARRGRKEAEAPERYRAREKPDAEARSRTRESINELGVGVTVEEKLAQLELKLKTQFEAAEQARHKRDEEARKERLEQAERVRQLLEKLEVLQEQFTDAEKKHEQAVREAEERVQAADARWRQEVEAAEQRQAKEKADLEERLKNITIVLNPQNPPVRDGVIVSGRSYAMYNLKYQSYFATLGRDQENLIMKPRLHEDGARQEVSHCLRKLFAPSSHQLSQKWRFHNKGVSGECCLWTIQSVSTGKYLCDPIGRYDPDIKVYDKLDPTVWCTRRIRDSQFRIFVHDDFKPSNKILITVQRGDLKDGDRIGVFNCDGHDEKDEIWVMEGRD